MKAVALNGLPPESGIQRPIGVDQRGSGRWPKALEHRHALPPVPVPPPDGAMCMATGAKVGLLRDLSFFRPASDVTLAQKLCLVVTTRSHSLTCSQ